MTTTKAQGNRPSGCCTVLFWMPNVQQMKVNFMQPKIYEINLFWFDLILNLNQTHGHTIIIKRLSCFFLHLIIFVMSQAHLHMYIVQKRQ